MPPTGVPNVPESLLALPPGLIRIDLVPMRQEIYFRDGTSVWLHRKPATQPHAAWRFTRLLGDGRPVNLARVIPDAIDDLQQERAGFAALTVHDALRKRYASAAEFIAAVEAGL